MNRLPVLVTVIVLNLLALMALVFVFPDLMVSPGPLVKGHAELAKDCFACHAAWRGASSERCVECHAVADIGLRTTKGVQIAAETIKGSFHQELLEQDCMACHSDHQGPQLTNRSRKPFSHLLLKDSVRERCASCHAAPKDNVHRDISIECGQCHQLNAWTPANFDHDMLDTTSLERCESCHHAPVDPLHRQIQGSCHSCHKTVAWKPATFDHNEYFVLDSHHDVACGKCHKNNDYNRYTCYGCHAHSPASIRSEHLEEGIRDFEDCVECHRSASEDDIRMSGGDREGDDD
jgi:hypothetical protein